MYRNSVRKKLKKGFLRQNSTQNHEGQKRPLRHHLLLLYKLIGKKFSQISKEGMSHPDDKEKKNIIKN
jgi:hypothetical protein